MYDQTHVDKLLTKELFHDWAYCSAFSKAFQFVSFHKVQKIHNTVALRTFLISSNKGAMSIEEGLPNRRRRTQTIPNKENS